MTTIPGASPGTGIGDGSTAALRAGVPGLARRPVGAGVNTVPSAFARR
jgi:hypothetical protein